MFRYLGLVLLMLTTFTVCLWPDLHPEKFITSKHFWYMDLIIHGGYYFIASLFLFSLRVYNRIYRTAVCFFVCSVVLELLQYFSYNRTVDSFDILSNLTGIVSALVVYRFYGLFRAKTIPG